MLDVFPLLLYLAAAVSAVLLIVLWRLGELRRRSGAVLLVWFALAGYAQFFAGSMRWGAIGLGLQTMLAIYLLLRWKAAA